jgi:protein-S-isoprenylcysteine O-methyltransferase Ste14
MTTTELSRENVDVASRTPRMDFGRLLMVPLVVGLLALNVNGIIASGLQLDLVDLAGAVLTAGFYALVLWAYARRSPARATRHHWPSHVAAIVASWLVFAFPLLPHGAHGATVGVAADVFLLCGSAWSLWSLRTLGRSFSVLAQARTIVTAGPYRLVRHPLYFGELVGAVGLSLKVFSVWSVITWTALVGLQLYRSAQEERVLDDTLGEYGSYRSRTKRLIPGLL